MKIYISGKISGLDWHEAKRKFDAAEQALNALGFEAVNPMTGETADSELTWHDHMLDDIRQLFGCDAILMLPDWRDSRGARIEHFIARELELHTIYQPARVIEQGSNRGSVTVWADESFPNVAKAA